MTSFTRGCKHMTSFGRHLEIKLTSLKRTLKLTAGNQSYTAASAFSLTLDVADGSSSVSLSINHSINHVFIKAYDRPHMLQSN